MPDNKVKNLSEYQDALSALVKVRTEELEESREMYKILAKASPVGVFRTTTDGKCEYVNAKWCEIAGMTIEEAAGDGWTNAIHEEDKEKVLTEWNKCIENGEDFSLEYRFRAKNGKTTWVLGQANRINGGGKGHVGTVTDITHKKETLPQLMAIRNLPKCGSRGF